jgi:hypothetical protein
MSIAEIIDAAQKDGVFLTLSSSGGIAAKGRQNDVDRWLATFRKNKAELQQWLKPLKVGLSLNEWHEYFNERFTVAKFNGNLNHEKADSVALAWCVERWLRLHPVNSQVGQCLHCGESDRLQLPYLASHSSQFSNFAWLHSDCAEAWRDQRKADALLGLKALGLPPNR